jgi:hypothetical protein
MLINHELLPRMIFEKNHKCKIYVELKFTTSFQIIERSSEPLCLIHSNISDFKVCVNKRWKKNYHITLWIIA